MHPLSAALALEVREEFCYLFFGLIVIDYLWLLEGQQLLGNVPIIVDVVIILASLTGLFNANAFPDSV